MMQRSFDDAPLIINPNQPHMACLLLLDTSGSMYGEPINQLNAALNRFKIDVCEDKHTRDVLDIAIVEFNTNVNVVQEFRPVEQMIPVNLAASGGTNMADAVALALDMVDERARFYRRAGTEPYKPWIIMISDGEADVSAIAPTVRQREADGFVKFFSLGVDNYDSKTLHQLSGEKVMKLQGHDFSKFFDWVNKSMRSVSASSPGERPKGVPLPDNVDKDTDVWMD